MGITKRIWIDKDPAYSDVRKQYATEVWDHMRQFSHRIPKRRRNKQPKGPFWDPIWPICVEKAIDKLGYEVARINAGIYFRKTEERDAVRSRAEEIWRTKFVGHSKI